MKNLILCIISILNFSVYSQSELQKALINELHKERLLLRKSNKLDDKLNKPLYVEGLVKAAQYHSEYLNELNIPLDDNTHEELKNTKNKIAIRTTSKRIDKFGSRISGKSMIGYGEVVAYMYGSKFGNMSVNEKAKYIVSSFKKSEPHWETLMELSLFEIDEDPILAKEISKKMYFGTGLGISENGRNLYITIVVGLYQNEDAIK